MWWSRFETGPKRAYLALRFAFFLSLLPAVPSSYETTHCLTAESTKVRATFVVKRLLLPDVYDMAAIALANADVAGTDNYVTLVS